MGVLLVLEVKRMGRPFIIEIAESEAQLKKTLQQARSASQKERLQMLYWLKCNQVSSRNELAERLGRDKATLTRWLDRYKRGGLESLLEVGKAPGKAPAVSGQALAQLKQRLAQRHGFGSYGEVQQWLLDEFDLDLKYSTVHQLVRYRLNAKLKVPRPKSIQQSPQNQAHFKKNIAGDDGVTGTVRPGQAVALSVPG
jgi:transposase